MGLENLAHPQLREQAVRLGKVLDDPDAGLLLQYPELRETLEAQAPGYVSRHLMHAHNVIAGRKAVWQLMRTEGKEVVGNLVATLRRGEPVNGSTSLEGADYLVFSSLYLGMAQSEGAKISLKERAEIELSLWGLRLMRKVWPGFDHVEAIGPTIEKNWRQNYPERPLKAPVEWTPSQMAEHYDHRVKPALRKLRNILGGKLPVVVADHLNEMRETPPPPYHLIPEFVPAYLGVLENTLKV